jgi:DNA-binding transcriptional ArsR family regulator
MTQLIWDSGTAYDLFISLFVLHHPADFGLRPSWTAGVRQRLSAPRRDFLERVYTFATVPLAWLASLRGAKDADSILHQAEALDPADCFACLTLGPEKLEKAGSLLETVSTRHRWTPEDRQTLAEALVGEGSLTENGLEELLSLWTQKEEAGRRYLAALSEYYRAFFCEEEARIQPALRSGLNRGRELEAQLPLQTLVETLSRGIRLEDLSSLQSLTLVPSFWISPLSFLSRPRQNQLLMAFSARSDLESVAPGAETPDALVGALKSLGDPTRLRILRYLARQPMTPTELAHLLRLRPPTIVHHLHSLRLAGLVHVSVGKGAERRYDVRLEALPAVWEALLKFLEAQR